MKRKQVNSLNGIHVLFSTISRVVFSTVKFNGDSNLVTHGHLRASGSGKKMWWVSVEAGDADKLKKASKVNSVCGKETTNFAI